MGWFQWGLNGVFVLNQRDSILVLGEKGPNQVKFTEIGKHHQCDIFTGTEGAIWLGCVVEENITWEGETSLHTNAG